MSDTKRDYLAVITTAYGGGSYARGPDRVDTIKRAAKLYKQDWKHLLKIGKTVKVNVIDVTGHDEVSWDDRGFYIADEETIVRLDTPVEVVEYIY